MQTDCLIPTPWCLTLELSGGVAVRLNDWLGRWDEACCRQLSKELTPRSYTLSRRKVFWLERCREYRRQSSLC